jgi:hypothetical protein
MCRHTAKGTSLTAKRLPWAKIQLSPNYPSFIVCLQNTLSKHYEQGKKITETIPWLLLLLPINETMLSLLLNGPDAAYNRTNMQEATCTPDQKQPTPIKFLYWSVCTQRKKNKTTRHVAQAGRPLTLVFILSSADLELQCPDNKTAIQTSSSTVYHDRMKHYIILPCFQSSTNKKIGRY